MDKQLQELISSVKFYIDLEAASGHKELLSAIPVGAGRTDDRSRAEDAPDDSLEALRSEVMRCRKCGLSSTRRHVVFGSGDPKARLMFIGEAPGEDEDIQGLPFVGRAGQLLTKIIEAMGLTRDRVYIANILKCRPPNNRAPLPDEIEACAGNVRRQVEIINPKVICTLGKFASQTLLETQTPISALRGKFKEYGGIKVMPTFHPAYLLRNPPDKKLVWEDMKKIMKELKEE
jgi:DNA polymerase